MKNILFFYNLYDYMTISSQFIDFISRNKIEEARAFIQFPIDTDEQYDELKLILKYLLMKSSLYNTFHNEIIGLLHCYSDSDNFIDWFIKYIVEPKTEHIEVITEEIYLIYTFPLLLLHPYLLDSKRIQNNLIEDYSSSHNIELINNILVYSVSEESKILLLRMLYESDKVTTFYSYYHDCRTLIKYRNLLEKVGVDFPKLLQNTFLHFEKRMEYDIYVIRYLLLRKEFNFAPKNRKHHKIVCHIIEIIKREKKLQLIYSINPILRKYVRELYYYTNPLVDLIDELEKIIPEMETNLTPIYIRISRFI